MMSETAWQGHRTTEWLRMEGTSGDHWSSPSAQAGPPGVGVRGPCPDGF